MSENKNDPEHNLSTDETVTADNESSTSSMQQSSRGDSDSPATDAPSAAEIGPTVAFKVQFKKHTYKMEEPETSTVGDLKRKLAELSGVEVERQKLASCLLLPSPSMIFLTNLQLLRCSKDC